MSLSRTTLTALAWIGAAAAVLVAMFVPLPRAVLSEEEQAAGRMPATRQQVDEARAEFERAQSDYRAHVSANDVGASLAAFDDAVAALEGNTSAAGTRQALEAAAAPLLAFLDRLEAYAGAGETYFNALRYYDDELMAWTRSLGAESEVLRSATWPIVEYLKLYPPPVGLDDDYTWTTAADVMTTTVTLRRSVTTGDPQALRTGSTAVREAGRNLEKIESLHPQYESLLREYDEKLQSVIAARGASEPDARRTLATILDASISLLLGLGIAGLLLPRRPAPGSAP
jgi:hypothetical protein